ncbi:MAG: HAD family phosphatase, partial [Deltaproteobacteria bacterium]|nr:HAD family phosphatase [Deltaproteobacteria bacterium]
DLDLTVLARNTGALWVRSELRTGHISYWQAIRAAGWLARYHLGFARLEEAILESISSLQGTLESEVRGRTMEFYEREVRHLVRPGALLALQRHRAAGEELWLLTSSSNYLSEAIAAELHIDGTLCNRFEVDPSGRYTGRPSGELCYGPGKVEVALRLARERGVALADCAFYTDSASDLPMLEAVGRPVAVHPDPRLKRIALKRGWPIADWGVPPARSPLAA